MPNKVKLKLNDLDVKSFTTSDSEVKGGGTRDHDGGTTIIAWTGHPQRCPLRTQLCFTVVDPECNVRTLDRENC